MSDKKEELPDISAEVNKTEKECILKVKCVDGACELSNEQSLSGILAGYKAACDNLGVNFLEFFLEEFGINHDIQYFEEGEGMH